MSEPEVKPYKIYAAPLPDRYARGWYCLGLASSFEAGKPRSLSYFGTKLVAFRGSDQQVHILDGYCPHMGADLSGGCVEGNAIRCPFHHWRWRSDGVCDDIPYASRIPKKAVIKKWHTVEQNHLLFVWYDFEENPPLWHQVPPKEADCFSGAWTSWAIKKITIPTNSRELVDNHADCAHFGPVHLADATSFKNIVQGHVFTQQMSSKSALLADGKDLYSEAIYYGPAYMISRMHGDMNGFEIASRLLVAHAPIDQNSFEIFFGVIIKRNEVLDRTPQTYESYVEVSTKAFLQDVEIWKSKTRIDNPLLCDGDGPIHIIRQWHAQFYKELTDVGEKWNQKMEFIIKNKRVSEKKLVGR